MKELEKRINYSFGDPKLLRTALTHSSFANESREKNLMNNERLEFLGDSVLGILTSEHLFRSFKRLPEGELTKMRATVVCEKTLQRFAKEIGLGEFLLLGKGEELSHGRERESILADAFEALIAAIYLDGGLPAARSFLIPFVERCLSEIEKNRIFKDYKTLLQEIVQKNREETLSYELLSESGPDHDKVFRVEVLLNSNCIGAGEGKSKKDAEQMAAKEALELMGE